jgi:hypothetical protein
MGIAIVHSFSDTLRAEKVACVEVWSFCIGEGVLAIPRLQWLVLESPMAKTARLSNSSATGCGSGSIDSSPSAKDRTQGGKAARLSNSSDNNGSPTVKDRKLNCKSDLKARKSELKQTHATLRTVATIVKKTKPKPDIKQARAYPGDNSDSQCTTPSHQNNSQLTTPLTSRSHLATIRSSLRASI